MLHCQRPGSIFASSLLKWKDIKNYKLSTLVSFFFWIVEREETKERLSKFMKSAAVANTHETALKFQFLVSKHFLAKRKPGIKRLILNIHENGETRWNNHNGSFSTHKFYASQFWEGKLWFIEMGACKRDRSQKENSESFRVGKIESGKHVQSLKHTSFELSRIKRLSFLPKLRVTVW